MLEIFRVRFEEIKIVRSESTSKVRAACVDCVERSFFAMHAETSRILLDLPKKEFKMVSYFLSRLDDRSQRGIAYNMSTFHTRFHNDARNHRATPERDYGGACLWYSYHELRNGAIKRDNIVFFVKYRKHNCRVRNRVHIEA